MTPLNNRKKQFLEGSIPRALLTLAVPIILGNILQTGYQLTDAFWVGRLGASAVAAVSVSFPVTFLVIALGAGLAMAGATLTSQYMGAGRQDMVNHVAAQTMLIDDLTKKKQIDDDLRAKLHAALKEYSANFKAELAAATA